MDKTEKLKHIILSKYNSVREFAKVAKIPSTTLTSALDKGIGGMAVDRIIKICEILNIDIRTFEAITNSLDINLSEEENILLVNFNELNSSGKKEANKRVAELTELPRYKFLDEKEDYLMPIAAHAKEGSSEEDIKSDIEKIKNLAQTLKDKK